MPSRDAAFLRKIVTCTVQAARFGVCGGCPSRVESAAMAPTAPSTSMGRTFGSFREIADFLWQNAERMRGTYKPNEYDKVILPFLVLRRLDCVLAPTRQKVLDQVEKLKAKGIKETDPAASAPLRRASGVAFYNTSKLDFAVMVGAPNQLAQDLRRYIKLFSPNAREVIERFKLDEQIARLDESNLLFQIVQLFAEVNLHPDAVPNHVMGSVFEELIRRFNEKKNEEAGDHYTPREVIRLMVDLLFVEDDDALRKPGIVRTVYDPACGTGGMLTVAEEYLRELNPNASIEAFGQEINAESWAICNSDLLITGHDPDHIVLGNSFSEDGHKGASFDYMLSNPPFGVDWKNVQKKVEDEHESLGFAGRFGPGLPRINDGALLFLLHMLSKMKPHDPKTGEGGSRIGIVLNGSPLFTGDAGSGESEIRRWVLEQDLLEAIVALPDQLFYNTGISTYVWILTNRKPKKRRGKVQLINAVDLFQKMRKSLGNKRNELGKEHIATIAKTFGDFRASKISKIFDNADFGYRRITIERPLRLAFEVTPERLDALKAEKVFQKASKADQDALLGALAKLSPGKKAKRFTSRVAFDAALGVDLPAPLRKAVHAVMSERDESAEVCTDAKGNVEPDAELRDYENVPLKEDIAAYFEREVKPHVPDAWIAGVEIKNGKAIVRDETKVKVGYEIPITRHFYEYKPLRPLAEIEGDIKSLEKEIQALLSEVLA
jgi:type I restriction enzyme M protein